MNVMKRAHELTVRRHNAKLLNGINPAPYKVLFAVALKDAHKEYKAMNQEQTTIKVCDILETLKADTKSTGFAIVGTVVSEGQLVHVGESSGSEGRMQSDASYYMNSKSGYSKQDLYLEFYGVHGCKKSLKIVK